MRLQAVSAVLLTSLGVSSARIVNRCKDGDKKKMDDAITDVFKLAQAASDSLDDTDKNPANERDDFYISLFPSTPDDVTAVQGVYENILQMEDDDRVISIFCDEDHVVQDVGTDLFPSTGDWFDTEFTYVDDDGNEKKIDEFEMGDNRDTKPGTRTSYALLGYKVFFNLDIADCSNQAHVFIQRQRIDPDPDDGLDLRPIDQIVNEGFLENSDNIVSLDDFNPLSHALFHELAHVAGGLSDPDKASGDANIVDGPKPGLYGMELVSEANMNFITGQPGGVDTKTIADAYTLYAIGTILQPKKLPGPDGEQFHDFVNWATGSVSLLDYSPVRPS